MSKGNSFTSPNPELPDNVVPIRGPADFEFVSEGPDPEDTNNNSEETMVANPLLVHNLRAYLTRSTEQGSQPESVVCEAEETADLVAAATEVIVDPSVVHEERHPDNLLLAMIVKIAAEANICDFTAEELVENFPELLGEAQDRIEREQARADVEERERKAAEAERQWLLEEQERKAAEAERQRRLALAKARLVTSLRSDVPTPNKLGNEHPLVPAGIIEEKRAKELYSALYRLILFLLNSLRNSKDEQKMEQRDGLQKRLISVAAILRQYFYLTHDDLQHLTATPTEEEDKDLLIDYLMVVDSGFWASLLNGIRAIPVGKRRMGVVEAVELFSDVLPDLFTEDCKLLMALRGRMVQVQQISFQEERRDKVNFLTTVLARVYGLEPIHLKDTQFYASPADNEHLVRVLYEHNHPWLDLIKTNEAVARYLEHLKKQGVRQGGDDADVNEYKGVPTARKQKVRERAAKDSELRMQSRGRSDGSAKKGGNNKKK